MHESRSIRPLQVNILLVCALFLWATAPAHADKIDVSGLSFDDPSEPKKKIDVGEIYFVDPAEKNPFGFGGYCSGSNDCKCGDQIRTFKEWPVRGKFADCRVMAKCHEDQVYIPEDYEGCSAAVIEFGREQSRLRVEWYQQLEKERLEREAREREKIEREQEKRRLEALARQRDFEREQAACDRLYVGQYIASKGLIGSLLHGSAEVVGVGRNVGQATLRSSYGQVYEVACSKVR